VTDPSAEARRIVSENSYLTLATADADGTPWANPVWFAAHGLDERFLVDGSEEEVAAP
jgi:predicted pyridoxine 5'-phosphate oxidase superfamily flavin-nucleotide-binding protein